MEPLVLAPACRESGTAQDGVRSDGRDIPADNVAAAAEQRLSHCGLQPLAAPAAGMPSHVRGAVADAITIVLAREHEPHQGKHADKWQHHHHHLAARVGHWDG